MRAKRVDENQAQIVKALRQCGATVQVSERRRIASLKSLEKANAANRLRPSRMILKNCLNCGNLFKVKPSHAKKTFYCSKDCMGAHYKIRMRGRGNPNFRNIAGKFCRQCGTKFSSYNKDRKFCSPKCYQASIPKMIERLGRMGRDNNQKQIVDALRSIGVSVLITSDIGHGFPDLVAGYNGKNTLLEVKNPNNQYGRRGFNENQKKFVETWQGESPVIVHTIEEAMKAVVTTVDEALAAIK